MLLFIVSTIFAFWGHISLVQATESELPPDGGAKNGQNQNQNQNQNQRQGDNSVNVDGDDNDYLALAIPNLVAANCAGQSYSLGAGGAGFGFGLGQALIDKNCQIAKAIATAHLLQRTGLVVLNSYEYRDALCQMRGMEHVCKAETRITEPVCKNGKKKKAYPGWCQNRIASDTKASRWSDHDLRACGLSRKTFISGINNWKAEEDCRTDPIGPSKETFIETNNGTYIRNNTETNKKIIEKTNKKVCKESCNPPPSHVVVRTGEHCGYDRVVFEWPKPVDYEVKRLGNKVSVDFSRPRSIDVSDVSYSLGRFILNAYAEKQYSGTRVTFDVSEGTKHRVWKWDRRVIVDIRKPGCDLG